MLDVMPPRSTRVHGVARARQTRSGAVGSTRGVDTGDCGPRHALIFDAFLTTLCLEDKVLAAVMSSFTCMSTRPTWRSPRLQIVPSIMVDGSVKWFDVRITYTTVRATDASDERERPHGRIFPGTGEALSTLLDTRLDTLFFVTCE